VDAVASYKIAARYPSMSDTRVFELADGRELAWIEYGSTAGAPVVAFHGSPGTRWFFAPLAQIAAQKRVRLIAPDRPGYGHSTYHPDRTYETWSRDVADLADHLRLNRFGVLGHSSGGPNAAACARFLSDRLVGCAIVSGPAPPEANIANQAMVRANRVGQRVAVIAPRTMSVVFGAGLRQAQRAPDKALVWMRRMLPPCDRAVMDRPEFGAAIREDLTRPLAATAARAAVQDIRLERNRWGFDLRDIALPVQVWHGDLDRNVVVDSGIYQAHELPNATLHRLRDEGHWLVYNHFDKILDSVSP
jgi:pimeloyl-ACP methyl ester carboxylesterase